MAPGSSPHPEPPDPAPGFAPSDHAGASEPCVPPSAASPSAPFTWPPRATPATPRGGSTALPIPTDSAALSAASSAARSPVLPPLTQSAAKVTTPAQLPLSPWEQFERVWLDLQQPPLERHLADFGWHPATPDSFCPRCGYSRSAPRPTPRSRPLPQERAAAHASAAPPTGSIPRDCDLCRDRRLPWDRLVRLDEYAPPLSRLVLRAKFDPAPDLCRGLGLLLGAALRHAIESTPAEPPQTLWLVPVPTSFRRRLTRGVDHPRLIAAAIAELFPNARLAPVLTRSDRPRQVVLTAAQRSTNVAGSMRPAAPVALADHLAARIIPKWRPNIWSADSDRDLAVLVDDTLTTGATLQETARALNAGFERARRRPPTFWAAVATVVHLSPDRS